MLADFRAAILAGLGLDPIVRPARHTVTAVFPEHGGFLLGVQDAMEFVEGLFPDVLFRTLPGQRQYDLREYRDVSADTTVFIAADRQASHLAALLPVGSAAIFFDCLDGGKSVRYRSDATMWTNMDNLRDVRAFRCTAHWWVPHTWMQPQMYYTVSLADLLPSEPSPPCNAQRFRVDNCRIAHMTLLALVSSSEDMGLPISPHYHEALRVACPGV